MHVLIIGGSDAGISAGLRIQELDSSVEVSIILRDKYPNFSICGLPFLISGETNSADQLAHRSLADLESAGLTIIAETNITSVDAANRCAIAETGKRFNYDKLILATGAISRLPDIIGRDLPGVFSLRWMGDALRMQSYLEQRKPSHGVIIGGGYIGLEMADGLHQRGIKLAIIEHNPALLRTVHPSLAEPLQHCLAERGIDIHTGTSVSGIRVAGEGLIVELSNGTVLATELVLMAVGAVPANQLAASAGVSLGCGGAMAIDRQMRTGVVDIWAAGDGVETYHRMLKRNTYMPLGTNSHKQGRIAGENAIGGYKEYAGTLGTQVVKVFDQVIARTGWRDREAQQAGFDPLTVPFECWSHKAYYPGAGRLNFRLTGDQRTGQLLGAQLIGPWGQEVSKRIDTFANALFHAMTVEELNDLDLSYTPPLSSPWDPVQMAAQHWCRQASSS